MVAHSLNQQQGKNMNSKPISLSIQAIKEMTPGQAQSILDDLKGQGLSAKQITALNNVANRDW